MIACKIYCRPFNIHQLIPMEMRFMYNMVNPIMRRASHIHLRGECSCKNKQCGNTQESHKFANTPNVKNHAGRCRILQFLHSQLLDPLLGIGHLKFKSHAILFFCYCCCCWSRCWYFSSTLLYAHIVSQQSIDSRDFLLIFYSCYFVYYRTFNNNNNTKKAAAYFAYRHIDVRDII